MQRKLFRRLPNIKKGVVTVHVIGLPPNIRKVEEEIWKKRYGENGVIFV